MEHLMKLLKQGVTAAHTIACVKEQFVEAGFQELDIEQTWKLEENGKYYVNLYETNCVAFRMGTHMENGVSPKFHIAMAHSDYPCFQIKPQPDIASGNVMKLNVDIYGGMYQNNTLSK